jgi:hypothetical protein
MNMNIVVEKDVPMPATVRALKYPFATMEIGDSFLIPNDKKQVVRAHALNFKRANPGWDYRTKTTMQGLRLWRTA